MATICKRLIFSHRRQIWGAFSRSQNFGHNRIQPSSSLVIGHRGSSAFSSLSAAAHVGGGQLPPVQAAASERNKFKPFPCLTLPDNCEFDRSTGRIKPAGKDDEHGGNSSHYNFLNLVRKGIIKTEKNRRTMWRGQDLSPEESECVGSSKGWLTFVNRENCGFYLFNPLIPWDSFSFPFILLPPIETLPNVLSKISKKKSSADEDSPRQKRKSFSSITTTFNYLDHYSPVTSQEMSKFLIKKVALSSSPLPFPDNPYEYGSKEDYCSENCTVMIMQGLQEFRLQGPKLAFCRLGDPSWTELEGPRQSYEDIIYVSKDKKFYALAKSNALEAWDLSCHSSPVMNIGKSSSPAPGYPGMTQIEATLRSELRRRRYLVESAGELLMVIRYYIDHPLKCYSRTALFDIFKLNFDKDEWEYMPSLGDRSLFVGLNESVSVCAADYPGLSEDSIYFIDSKTLSHEDAIRFIDSKLVADHTGRVHSLGHYRLKQRQIYPLYPEGSDVNTEDIDDPLVWIFPQL